METRLAPSRSSLSSLRTSSSLKLLNLLFRLRQVSFNFLLQFVYFFFAIGVSAGAGVKVALSDTQFGFGRLEFGLPQVKSFHFSLSIWLRFHEQLACNCQAPSV